MWDEDFTFVLKDYKQEVILQVFDHDFLKDDFLGKVVIPLEKVKKANGTLQGWFDLYNDKLTKRTPGAVFVKLVVDEDMSKQRKSDPLGFQEYRRTLINKKTDKLDREILQREKIKLFVGTWNVGNAPPDEDLSAWLPKAGFDLIAIGAQECEYAPRKGYANCAKDWAGTLSSHYGESYILVGEYNLMQMRLLIFAHEKLSNVIDEVRKETEATGIAGVVGNKGGVAIALKVMDTSFVFVNSHLAAHQHKKKKRNEDVCEVISNIRNLGIRGVDILHQYDHVVYMGDLNYRLDYGDQGDDKTPSKEIFDEMVTHIKNENFEFLFGHDQLQAEMKENKVFIGFEEGEYNFPPTFKVLRGQESGYTEQRSPAWCDRILWRSFAPKHLEQTALGSSPSILSSDHKPVYSTFDVVVRRDVCARSDKYGEFSVQFSNLKCTDLPVADLTGSSDPFLVFDAPGLKKVVKLPTKFLTTNPSWEDKEVPPLTFLYNNKERLRNAFIPVQVWDYDAGKQNDPLALGIFHLRDYIGNNEEEEKEENIHQFDMQLYHGGLPAGRFTGSIQLKWEKPTFEPIDVEAYKAGKIPPKKKKK